MLVQQRHKLILEEVAKTNSVSIRHLSDRLGVSRETIRKDIEALSDLNELKQVRGGAVRVQTYEPHISNRSSTNPDGKEKIATIVADIIPNGASIIIDNGSTTQAIARALLSHHHDLIIYTNDLKIAEILAPAAREVNILGGRLDLNELATSGLETIESLAKYRAEYSLVSAGGLNAIDLFTDFTHEVAALRNNMISQAEQAIIVADHSKFETIGQIKLKPAPAGSIVITDIKPPTPILDALNTNRLTAKWN